MNADKRQESLNPPLLSAFICVHLRFHFRRVRLPYSVHAALLAEAKAEGVSLNQLCLSKLVAQLRAVV